MNDSTKDRHTASLTQDQITMKVAECIDKAKARKETLRIVDQCIARAKARHDNTETDLFDEPIDAVYPETVDQLIIEKLDDDLFILAISEIDEAVICFSRDAAFCEQVKAKIEKTIAQGASEFYFGDGNKITLSNLTPKRPLLPRTRRKDLTAKSKCGCPPGIYENQDLSPPDDQMIGAVEFKDIKASRFGNDGNVGTKQRSFTPTQLAPPKGTPPPKKERDEVKNTNNATQTLIFKGNMKGPKKVKRTRRRKPAPAPDKSEQLRLFELKEIKNQHGRIVATIAEQAWTLWYCYQGLFSDFQDFLSYCKFTLYRRETKNQLAIKFADDSIITFEDNEVREIFKNTAYYLTALQCNRAYTRPGNFYFDCKRNKNKA